MTLRLHAKCRASECMWAVLCIWAVLPAPGDGAAEE